MVPTISKVMIGDLLLVNGKVTKVARENINYVLNTLCQPIPLTKDFFEKNGWTKEKSEYYEGYFFPDNDFFVMYAHEFHDGMWQIDYEYNEKVGKPAMVINTCWIHEFCRFLDLCGINDDMIKHVEFKEF